MSGNLYFEKRSEEQYELVFNYSDMLGQGESIREYSVFVNNIAISGLYEDRLELYNSGVNIAYDTVFVHDADKYDSDVILIQTDSGIISSGYDVSIDVVTNQRNTYNKTISVFIDELAYPEVFGNFEYSFLVDIKDVYILPVVYQPQLSFTYNTEYTVNIFDNITSFNGLTLEHQESFWFTSKYCPMFTSYGSIVLILGPEAEKFTLDTINRLIFRISREAIDLINLSAPCGGSGRIQYDHYGCTPDGVPYNLRRYVECKVAYNLLNLIDRLRTIGGSAGGQTKSLGDMSISYGGTGGSSGGGSECPTCGPKKDFYDCWKGLEGILSNNPTLCGTGAGINNGVRGLYDGSKGFVHPVRDAGHNRIVKQPINANGPWYGNNNNRYPTKGGF